MSHITLNLTLGTLIGLYRRSLGLSEKTLAERLGISPQYLNDIEMERRTPHKPELIDKLSAELGVSADIFYFCIGKLPPDINEDYHSPDAIVAAFNAMRSVLNG